MIAAIYARKSNEQTGVSEDQKSVTRQIDGARAFIARKGWTLDEAHVYTDDGVSGALFSGRAEFQRMMRDAEAGTFEAVVLYDLDRFGRHAHKTMVALNALADLGVTVWDFSTGAPVDLDSFEGRLSATLRAEFAQQYRDQVRKHTRDSHRRKAEQGLVTGGKVFGYDNVRVMAGQTKRVPNPEEAEVVREIYLRFAQGDGARTIAAVLNQRRAPSPRAQQGRPSGWSASTIREVLRRPLYRGEIVYGRTTSAYGRELGKLYRAGRVKEKAQIPTPEGSWTRVQDDAMRIVDLDVIARVDALRQDRRSRYLSSLGGARQGRDPEKTHGKYLLTGGMLVCPTCLGHFEAIKYPEPAYVCATRRRKPGACTNTLMLPMRYADDVVLDMIEDVALGERYINELLSFVRDAEYDDTTRLMGDKARLTGEVENLLKLAASGLPAETVVPAVRQRQAEIARLDIRLRNPKRQAPNIERLREALTERAASWRATLRGEPRVARAILRRIIGPLVLHDESTRPEWIRAEASAKPALLDGLVQEVASPTGFEPVF
ncbi:MAG: recombinase family protein [Vicinamibacterales bacterium]